jgi:hypothetical protein
MSNKPVPSVPNVNPNDLFAIGRDRKRRIEFLRRYFAINPKAVQKEIAEMLGVDERTIKRDMQAIKAAAGERVIDQVPTVAEILETYDIITQDAMADAARVDPASNARAGHRNTALKAQQQMFDALVRLGYLREAPKEVRYGGSPGSGPIRLTLEGEANAAVLEFHEVDDDTAGRGVDDVYPAPSDAEGDAQTDGVSGSRCGVDPPYHAVSDDKGGGWGMA